MDKDLLVKIEQVIKVNTTQNILTIAIEELSELMQVICKLKRLTNRDKTLRKEEKQIYGELKEELADVFLRLLNKLLIRILNLFVQKLTILI